MFLIDWFTCSLRDFTLEQVKTLIGMPDECIHWEQLGGCNGYPESHYYNGIRIMYGASEQMGICLNMSGQGCRTFESFGAADWIQFFDILVTFSEKVNITRLDLAFDDHSGVLDIAQIKNDTDEGNWTAKLRWWVCEYGSQGTSLYYGSPKSKIRCRIYDKAAERQLEDQHWIRVELQLRDGNADSAVKYLHSGVAISDVFTGVLRNYIQFREPDDTDSNKSRWPLADYWAEFLNEAAPLTLWIKPGCEYNLSKLQWFVIDHAGNAISCYVAIHGFDSLIYYLRQYKPVTKLPPKYQMLLDLASLPGGGFDTDDPDGKEEPC